MPALDLALTTAVALIVLVIAGIASYLPARRTSTVAPATALREGS